MISTIATATITVHKITQSRRSASLKRFCMSWGNDLTMKHLERLSRHRVNKLQFRYGWSLSEALAPVSKEGKEWCWHLASEPKSRERLDVRGDKPVGRSICVNCPPYSILWSLLPINALVHINLASRVMAEWRNRVVRAAFARESGCRVEHNC